MLQRHGKSSVHKDRLTRIQFDLQNLYEYINSLNIR